MREDEVETTIATLCLEPAGWIRLTMKPNTLSDMAAAEEIKRAVAGILARQEDPSARPMLVDMRVPHRTTPEARRIGGSAALRDTISKLALLVNSPVGRMVANGFLYAARPRVPTKVFNSESEAIHWLQST
jgi:hypothetical protein